MRDDGLAEQEGEGYFASVSDLMVGVLFVFLLLMTVFALNFRDDKTKLADVIARAERAETQAELAKQSAQEAQERAEQEKFQAQIESRRAVVAEEQARLREIEAVRLRLQNELLRARLADAATALERELRDREEVRAGLLQRLASRLESAGIRFVLDQQSGVLRLSDAVPFPIGRSDLADPVARNTVEVLARVLGEILPCFSTAPGPATCQADDGPVLETVLVEGHTDRQSYTKMTAQQSEAENDKLATARALTVFATLRQVHPALDGLRNPGAQPLLGVSGYGQRRPLPDALTNSEPDQARNRRIDLRFVLSARTSDELRRLLGEINRLSQQASP